MTVRYYDLRQQTTSDKIDLLFPRLDPASEHVVVFSPHDDDGILGAGYLIHALQEIGCPVSVMIFCDGRAGYSTPQEAETIVERRRAETIESYGVLGLGPERIIRLDLPDFSAMPYLGWVMPWGEEGTIARVIPKLRALPATRLVIPNGYHEHIDHEATYRSGAYDGPQVGDNILAKWGKPSRIRTTLVYAVWGDFSPEDALLDGRDLSIRANRAISVDEAVEEKIAEGIRKFASQERVIEYIMTLRKSRCNNQNRWLELYQDIDPRPALPMEPYWDLIRWIEGEE
ncbi:MAG: PIG-L family deacetylase [bacterium]